MTDLELVEMGIKMIKKEKSLMIKKQKKALVTHTKKMDKLERELTSLSDRLDRVGSKSCSKTPEYER